MGLAESNVIPSWQQDITPMVLAEIVSKTNSVVVWKRPVDSLIERYFAASFSSLGLGVRSVFTMDTLKQGLSDALPDGEGKTEAIDDIFLLADMLTCLFDCDSVGVRLVPLGSAMCPNFHTDKIPVRLVNTYLGAGTEWLPSEYVQKDPAEATSKSTLKLVNKGIYRVDAVQQLNAFDVALLKGAAWPKQEHMATIHRSCAVNEGEQRVLLTLDPV